MVSFTNVNRIWWLSYLLSLLPTMTGNSRIITFSATFCPILITGPASLRLSVFPRRDMIGSGHMPLAKGG